MRRESGFPTKTTINLAQRERRGNTPGFMLPAVIAMAILIGIFCRFGVISQLNRESDMERKADQAEQLLSSVESKTADYESVREEYEGSTAAKNALSGGVDPMECLTLIEKNLLSGAKISSFAVADDTISVQIFDVTLNEISVIYAQLKDSSLVSGVQVYTASSDAEKDTRVTASLTIALISADTGSEEAAS